MSLDKFLDAAGRAAATTAEVALPLAGLVADGGTGMQVGNTLASLIPGTAQNDQRQMQRNQVLDARAQQIASAAMHGSNVMLTDQLQTLRLRRNMGSNDSSDAQILASQDGRQAVGINAINGLLTQKGRGDDELRAAGLIAEQVFGASFDPKTMSFAYQGQTYDLSNETKAEEILGQVQDYAMRNTVNGVLADGLKLAANKDFGAASQQRFVDEFTGLGLDKGKAFAASRSVMSGIPEEMLLAHRLATGWKQFLDDEAAENAAGYEDKGARLLQEFENLPGVTLVGDPEADIPASARKVRIQPGSDIARLLGIGTKSAIEGIPLNNFTAVGNDTDIPVQTISYTLPDAELMSAAGLAHMIDRAMNVPARARMYYQAHHESDKDFYLRVAKGKEGREIIEDFLNSIGKGKGLGEALPGMKDDMGNIALNDATFAEFRRYYEYVRGVEGEPITWGTSTPAEGGDNFTPAKPGTITHAQVEEMASEKESASNSPNPAANSPFYKP